jgi:hypothetical protein
MRDLSIAVQLLAEDIALNLSGALSKLLGAPHPSLCLRKSDFNAVTRCEQISPLTLAIAPSL